MAEPELDTPTDPTVGDAAFAEGGPLG